MPIDGISANQMRFWGLASGLDVDEIVRGLIQAERAPLDHLVQRKQTLEWQQDDLRKINLMLRDLKDLAFQLRLASTYQTRTVKVSDESGISATIGAGAAVGTHTLLVNRLAEGVRFTSGQAISTGDKSGKLNEQFTSLSGTISFKITNAAANGGAGATEEFTFDTANATLADVVAQINASGLGLKAVYEADLDRFFLTSEETGEHVSVSFDDPDNFLTDVLKLQHRGSGISAGTEYQGVDAEFIYDGATITSATNQFTAGGVTYTLLKADPANPITVTVSQDTDATIDKIESFVNKYNEIVTYLNGKLREKRYYDYPPLTSAQREEMSEKEIALWEERARSGLLRGDNMLTRILSNMRLALGSAVSGAPSHSTLSSIGITTGAWEEHGILHLDRERLRAALEEDAEGVAALFRQEGSDSASTGLIRRLESVLDLGMEQITNRVGRPGAAVDQSAIGRQIGWIDDAIDRAQARLAAREAYLYRQFAALETFMSQMNTQSLWLAQAFGGFMG